MPSESAGRGVSEVLGDVLLVAIVVILAALIAPFAYDLATKGTDAPPQAVFVFETTDDGKVLIDYDSGPDIETTNLELGGEDPDGNVSFGEWPENGTLTPGDNVIIPNSTGNEEVRIIWADDADRTYILAEHEY